MRSTAFLACTAAALIFPVSSAGQASGDSLSTPKIVPGGDVAMEAAFRKAQNTLDSFLAIAKSPPPHVDSVSIKVRVREGNNNEYFWVAPFRQEANGFSGFLGNQPYLIRKYKLGDLIRFPRAGVVDWMYVDTSKQRIVGNFTACAILSKESAAEREKARTQHGLHCDG